jgi:hypothetical protein
MHTSARLALLGTFDVSNYGDHLFPAIVHREVGVRLSTNIDYYSPTSSRFFSDCWNDCYPIRKLRRAKDIRALIVGGGQLLNPEYGGLLECYKNASFHVRMKLLLLIGVARVARASGRSNNAQHSKRTWEQCFGFSGPLPLLPSSKYLPPQAALIINGCGAYDLSTSLDKHSSAELRGLLEKAAYVSVRDDFSAKCLRRLNVTRHIAVVPDTALMVPLVFPECLTREIINRPLLMEARMGGDYMVVQGGIPADRVAMVKNAVEALRTKEKITVILLPVRSWARDLEALRILWQAGGGRFKLIGKYLNPPEIVALIANASRVITNGLHSLVTAVAYGRRVVALPSEDPKICGFLKMLSLEELQCNSWEDVPSALLGVNEVPARIVLGASERGRTVLRAHFEHISSLCSRVLGMDSVRPGIEILPRA